MSCVNLQLGLPDMLSQVHISPTVEWHTHGLYEFEHHELAICDANGVADEIGKGDFVCVIDVDEVTEQAVYMSTTNANYQMPLDSAGHVVKLACIIDIVDIARRLLNSAIVNCDPGVVITELMVCDLAEKLAKAIQNPLDENGHHIAPIIFSLAPAITMQRGTGEVLAYGVGQLLGRGNNSNMIMLVRGFAHSRRSRQIIIESVAQSLLPVHEISNEPTY